METQPGPGPESTAKPSENALKPDLSHFPHGKSMFESYKGYVRHHPTQHTREITIEQAREKDLQRIDTARSIIEDLFKAQLDGTRIYHEAEGYASFPIAVMDLTAIGKRIYERERGKIPEDLKAPEEDRNLLIVEFQAAIDRTGGTQFSSVEETLDYSVRYLPRILRAYKDGKQPPHILLATMGLPTQGQLGKIDPEFLQKLGYADSPDRPLDVIGRMHAQCLDAEIPDLEKYHVLLEGTSMGTAFAEVAGAELLRAYPDLSLQILENYPAPFHAPGEVGEVQTKLGVASSIINRNPIRFGRAIFGEKKFMRWVSTYLQNRNQIQINDPEDRDLAKNQNDVISLIKKDIYRGREHDQSLSDRITIVQGTRDLTTVTPDSLKKILQHTKLGNAIHRLVYYYPTRREGLAESLLQRIAGEPRTAAIRATHRMPYYQHPSRINRAVQAVQELSEPKSAA